ncbi:hypothetical protein F4775DRAFT_596273 [Biscogniauxia sp. FL1348]|nr:hypothetical protein F4775DRAFT_596273 [Biscogniauxia sp. FL1348]
MTKIGSKTTHHCPKKFKGNCRLRGIVCVAHQVTCPKHGTVFLCNQYCKECEGEQVKAEKKAREEREKIKAEGQKKGYKTKGHKYKGSVSSQDSPHSKGGKK